MNISARSDYALRAMLALAAETGSRPMKGEDLAASQEIPQKFLENILVELRRAGLLLSQRGADGGYRLARPAETITLAEVIRAVDGPLANIRGLRPETVQYAGAAQSLRDVWVAMRASLRSVLEAVTLADVVAGRLPPSVRKLTAHAEAWQPH